MSALHPSRPHAWGRPPCAPPARFALLLLLLACAGLGCSDRGGLAASAPQPAEAVEALPRARLSVGMHVFDVEVADTPERKTRGLAGHAPLGPGQGMVFAYDRPGLYAFWMKGMQFAIDIVWIRGDRVVGITHEVPVASGPGRPPVYRPPEPADLILELAAGTARSKGLAAGHPVTLAPELRRRP